MSEFYSGMPGPAAIDRLNSLWSLAQSVGGQAAAAEAAAESATNAAIAASAAAAVYDNFDDRYLGPKAQPPTQDNDGNTLVTGALYFNTTDQVMYVRTSSATWISVASAASQISAANSAATASTQATSASNSATAAGNSATAAATQATNASNSAIAAGNSATTATTQATNASNSAISAGNSATTASTQATNAYNSALAAADSANSAAAAYDSFDDRFLGPKTQEPSTDNDGNAILTGALYFNTTDNHMYVRTVQAVWVTVSNLASSTAAATSASEALTSAGIAQGHASTASTAATNAGNSASAAQGYASTASTAATNAGDSASTAQGHATTASTAATNAGNSASAAQGYASTASTAATNAGNSAGAALTSANNASTSESQAAISANEALDYKNLAADWAEKATEVEPGKYSAKYWAQQASASISGQLVYRGQWSAAGGTYPTTPALGDFYKISVAGTISGIVYAVSDSIIYNGTSWDKIDNTEEANLVSQVAGKQGDVVLVKGDVGLDNVDNTADSAKPVSTAQQTALDLKADLSSPTFTGVPAAPTAAVGTNTTQLATTAYVRAEIAADAAPIAHVGSGGAAHADVVAGGAAGFMSGADKTKLDGVSTGATANATDTQLRDRQTHTGAQAISTVTGLQTALDSKQEALVSGTNIKTVNGNSLLGSGDIDISTGDVEGPAISVNNEVALFDGVTGKVIKGGGVLASVAISGSYNDLTDKPTVSVADWNTLENKPAVIAAGANQAAARTAIGAAVLNGSNTFSGNQTFNNSINVLGNVTIKSNSATIQSEVTSSGAFLNIAAGWLSTASGGGSALNLSSGSINNPSNTAGNGGDVYIQSGTNLFTPDKEGSIVLRHGYKTPVLELPNDLSFVVNGQAGTAGQILTSAGAGNPVAWTNVPATDWSNITNKPAIIAAGADQVAARTAIGAASAADLAGKQNTLVSGTDIKTINGTSVLGSGDLEVGYKNIPQNSKSAAYTLVLEDAGKHIFHPAGDTTARTFTIPANSSVAFPIGTAITFINQNGTGGVVNIAIATDTLRLAGQGTTGTRTLARNGVATAVKITANEWIISGSGLT